MTYLRYKIWRHYDKIRYDLNKIKRLLKKLYIYFPYFMLQAELAHKT